MCAQGAALQGVSDRALTTARRARAARTAAPQAAKNRMAFQKPDASGKLPYTGTLQTISKVATTEGATALYRGFSMYYVRCGGHTVISFLMLEELRRLYRVQTGT